jgi:uridine kinase
MSNSPYIVAIAGGSGAGKTTLAKALQVSLPDAAIIYHDSYYRDQADIPMAERELVNYDHPDSLETSLLIKHVNVLKNNQSVQVPQYDFPIHTRSSQTTTCKPHAVLILDGILILHDPGLRSLIDFSFFVTTPSDIRFIRRLSRDLAERGRDTQSVIDQYLDSVRQAYEAYIAPTKHFADMTIDGMGDVQESVTTMQQAIAKRHVS